MAASTQIPAMVAFSPLLTGTFSFRLAFRNSANPGTYPTQVKRSSPQLPISTPMARKTTA